MTSSQSLERVASALYEKHLPLLVNIAIFRFHIPREDALAVTHDAFVSFMRAGRGVRDPERWLVAAICNTSRQYLRDHRSTADTLDGDVPLATDVDAVLRCIDAAKVLAQLSPVCREILTHHYLEGWSAREIGEIRETTTRFAEREIHRCLENARRVLREDDDAPRA